MFRNEKGLFWTITSLMCIPVTMLLAGIFFDLARALWVKQQTQTAVDAAALAGAMTGQLVDTTIEIPIYDSNGNLIGVQQQTTWSVQIDQVQADQQAQLLYNLNIGQLSKELAFCPSSDVSGQVPTPDSYASKLTGGNVSTILLGKIMSLYGYSLTSFPINVNGTAKAVPVY